MGLMLEDSASVLRAGGSPQRVLNKDMTAASFCLKGSLVGRLKMDKATGTCSGTSAEFKLV